MKKIFFFIFLLIAVRSFTQTDTSKWVRAFPVTDYIVDITDSIKLVQVHLPDGPVLQDRQPGLLRSIYKTNAADTGTIGSGRCHLIKGAYYYFTVNYKASGRTPQENDLLYTVVDKPNVYRHSLLRVASHFIELQNVYEEPLYDRNNIFKKWTAQDEQRLIDSMAADIRFTGDYFLKNTPSMNVQIKGGKYDGKMVLEVMMRCSAADVATFLDYMLARPRLYAGNKWKISEIFATWLSNGAPGT